MILVVEWWKMYHHALALFTKENTWKTMSFSVPNAGLRRKEAQTTKYEETKLLREQVETYASRPCVETMRREIVDTDACSNSCHVIMKKDNTQSDHGRTNRLTIWKVYAAWLKFNHKVSGHHDINFLTPINSPKASPRKGGRETSSRGESFALFLLYHNQPPVRTLLREGF